MCRMFGFRSAVPSRAHRSLVEAENALSSQAVSHPDGWGIGWFVDEDAYVVKSSNAAHGCDGFQRTSARLMSHTFVVHVRRATVGRVDPLNVHPFRFGRWLFAHNGTLLDYDRLGPWLVERTDPELQALVLGDTDSEQLFFWLLGRVAAAGGSRSGRRPSDPHLVGEAVREALLELDRAAIALGAGRPLVNVLLTDGRLLVAHKAGMPLHLSTQKRHCADAERCPAVKVCLERVRPAGHPVNHLLVASEPIAATENLWEEIEDGETVVLEESFHLHRRPPPEGWVAPVLPESMRALAARGGAACS